MEVGEPVFPLSLPIDHVMRQGQVESLNIQVSLAIITPYFFIPEGYECLLLILSFSLIAHATIGFSNHVYSRTTL